VEVHDSVVPAEDIRAVCQGGLTVAEEYNPSRTGNATLRYAYMAHPGRLLSDFRLFEASDVLAWLQACASLSAVRMPAGWEAAHFASALDGTVTPSSSSPLTPRNMAHRQNVTTLGSTSPRS